MTNDVFRHANEICDLAAIIHRFKGEEADLGYSTETMALATFLWEAGARVDAAVAAAHDASKT